MEMTTEISTDPAQFVLERNLQGGVHVCASHPRLGHIYWRVIDNSDVGLPDTFSLTTDPSKALRLPVNWRSHWLYGPKYKYLMSTVLCEEVDYVRVEHCGPPVRNEDYEYCLEQFGLPEALEMCDNGLTEYVARLSGALYRMAESGGLAACEILEWLKSAEWSDAPAGTLRVYLEDMNGFVGYTPVWTNDIAKALTFHKDDPELDMLLGYGRLIPYSSQAEAVGA